MSSTIARWASPSASRSAAIGRLRPSIVTTQPGSTQPASDPLTLHRYEVLNTTGTGGLAAMLAT